MIKMPYKKPLRKKGVRESPFAHFIKLSWFEVHFRDIQNKISRREFCINFKKHVIDTGIIEDIESEYNLCWNFYNDDGSMKQPNYDNDLHCNEWIKKYEWNTQYSNFKSDKLGSVEMTERERYIRNLPNLNNKDYDLIDTCYKKEKEFQLREKETGKDMTYYRNKNNDTISNADDRLRKRNGFDKTKLEVDGNLKADVHNTNETNYNFDEKVLGVIGDALERRNTDGTG